MQWWRWFRQTVIDEFINKEVTYHLLRFSKDAEGLVTSECSHGVYFAWEYSMCDCSKNNFTISATIISS